MEGLRWMVSKWTEFVRTADERTQVRRTTDKKRDDSLKIVDFGLSCLKLYKKN